jgi:hypothetical protein
MEALDGELRLSGLEPSIVDADAVDGYAVAVTPGVSESRSGGLLVVNWKSVNTTDTLGLCSRSGLSYVPADRLALWGDWWEFYLDYAQTITLYEIDNVMAYNSAEFEFTPRKDGWFTFRDLQLVDN